MPDYRLKYRDEWFDGFIDACCVGIIRRSIEETY
jgi:hypothetical protein